MGIINSVHVVLHDRETEYPLSESFPLILQYNHQRNVTARHRRIISDHKYMYLLCYDSIYKRRQADGERGHSLFHA
jgi:hypothetical protein